jgi:catechol 2,3-dioxygenase-like lactoylglutathione lyase family enzyme
MKISLHHPHLFSSNIKKSVEFYREMFGAKVLFDLEMAGARNVMISIGSGKINFYDQPPKDHGRGAIHHLGIETDDLENLVVHMKNKGFIFKKSIKALGPWKYIMAEGPDHILLELFEIVKNKVSKDQYNSITSLVPS